MRLWIRSLSGRAELWLVITICFGIQIASAIAVISQRKPEVLLGPTEFIRTGALEILSLAVTFWIWTIRDHPYRTFGWRISWKGTGAGILLFIAMIATSVVAQLILSTFLPPMPVRIVRITRPLVLVISIVNAVFEETIECGYFINTLRHLGMLPAVLASAALTAFLHAYQGFNGIAGVFLLRVLIGSVYWRWKQLWPLILAHALFDFFGLAANLVE